jgi:predicted ATP-dependent protease
MPDAQFEQAKAQQEMARQLKRVAEGFHAVNVNLVELIKAIRAAGIIHISSGVQELRVDENQEALPLAETPDEAHKKFYGDGTGTNAP